MIPAFIRIQVINPQRVKVTITDERVPVEKAQPELEGMPPAQHKPKVLFSFYCNPEEMIVELASVLENSPPDRLEAEVEE